MNYLIKSTLKALFTVYLVVTLTFVLIRFLPGGPMEYLRAQLLREGGASGLSQERLNALIEVYTNVNPDDPLYIQYIDFLTRTLQGDLGRSIWYNEPIGGLIAEALPWTLFLMSITITLTFGFGIIFGGVMAYAEGSRFDVGASATGLFLNSVPYYIFAILGVYILGFVLGWFPTGGRMMERTTPGFNAEFLLGALYHAALPIFSMFIARVGGRAIEMRGNAVRVLGEDYIRVANLRGLGRRRIALRYVARNALLPMYTKLMISIGSMFGGAIIVEKIFDYEGIGLLMLTAINSRDHPLMMATFLMITFTVIVGIYFADLTYSWVDPRVKQGGDQRESF